VSARSQGQTKTQHADHQGQDAEKQAEEFRVGHLATPFVSAKELDAAFPNTLSTLFKTV
jgi:hypothetical protein